MKKRPGDAQIQTLKHGHRQRLRMKFLRSGLDGFLNYEIVELLLTLGTPRQDCRRAAREAIRKFKTLRGVLEAPSERLLEIQGIGPKNIIGLKLIQEVSRQFLKEKMLAGACCRSSKEVFDYLYHTLRDSKREQFKALFLDAKNKIIDEKTVFQGTVDSSAVYPREIIREALRSEATSLIFVHNHPSGDPSPSESDKEITRELIFASGVMQIRVLDHIVIGNNCYFSFADSGLMEVYESDFRERIKKPS